MLEILSIMEKSFISKEALTGIVYLSGNKSSILEHFNLAINRFGFCIHKDQSEYLNFSIGAEFSKWVELLFNFFPCLDFLDIYEIISNPTLSPLINKEELFKKYHIPPNEKVLYLMRESKLHWTSETLNWISEKKIRPQDLLFLLNLQIKERASLLHSISSSPLSKSQALQFLEWACDLIMLKMDICEITENLITDASLIKIKELRYPKSFLQHPLQKLNLNWGSKVQSQFLRKQDRAGLQIQFFVSSPDELQNVIQLLQKNQNEWRCP